MNPQPSEPEFSSSDLGLVECALSPARTALIRAFTERVNALYAALPGIAERSQRPETKDIALAEIEALGPVIREFLDVASWLYPPRRALTMEEALRHALQLKEAGLDGETIQSTISGLQEIPPGRPHQRERYIEVFDLMLQSRRMSRRKAIQKLYPHLSNEELAKKHLEENIKAGIVSLKKLLRRYAPELLTEYDRLHPDRANKKVNG